jgi:hypothetical protein
VLQILPSSVPTGEKHPRPVWPVLQVRLRSCVFTWMRGNERSSLKDSTYQSRTCTQKSGAASWVGVWLVTAVTIECCCCCCCRFFWVPSGAPTHQHRAYTSPGLAVQLMLLFTQRPIEGMQTASPARAKHAD